MRPNGQPRASSSGSQMNGSSDPSSANGERSHQEIVLTGARRGLAPGPRLVVHSPLRLATDGEGGRRSAAAGRPRSSRRRRQRRQAAPSSRRGTSTPSSSSVSSCSATCGSGPRSEEDRYAVVVGDRQVETPRKDLPARARRRRRSSRARRRPCRRRGFPARRPSRSPRPRARRRRPSTPAAVAP